MRILAKRIVGFSGVKLSERVPNKGCWEEKGSAGGEFDNLSFLPENKFGAPPWIVCPECCEGAPAPRHVEIVESRRRFRVAQEDFGRREGTADEIVAQEGVVVEQAVFCGLKVTVQPRRESVVQVWA